MNKPLVWVVHASGGTISRASSSLASSSVSSGHASTALRSLMVLNAKDEMVLKKGERVSLIVLANQTRRDYVGPAKLRVTSKSITVRLGARPQVFPLTATQQAFAAQWLARYPAGSAPTPIPLGVGKLDFQVQTPRGGELMFSLSPVFQFSGALPREARLLIFNDKNRRFWVQPLEEHTVSFPPAADFELGKTYTWEIRKLTGGSLLKGSFRMASRQELADFQRDRAAMLQSSSRIDQVFYALRLQQAGAWKEAQEVWSKVGAM